MRLLSCFCCLTSSSASSCGVGQPCDSHPSGSQEAEAAPAARGSAAVTDASAADLDALAARLRSAAEASAQQRRDRGGAAASDFLAPSGGQLHSCGQLSNLSATVGTEGCSNACS